MNEVLDTILGKLGKRARIHEHSNGTYSTLCPGHNDKQPSLSISAGDDGRVLLTCHAGCEVEAIVAELGLTMSDLFADKPERENAPAKSQIVATYPYHNEAGELLFEVVRFSPKTFRQRRPDGDGGFIWGLGETRRVLYRLPVVLEAVKQGQMTFIVEGEKDVAALESAGLTATTNPGGAGKNKWRPEYSECLKGADVVILPDNDPPGREHAESIAASLSGIAQSVRIVNLPDLPPKGDVSDWLKAGGTLAELLVLVEVCSEWEPGNASERTTAPPRTATDRHEYTLSDLGNARRLIDRHGSRLRFNKNTARWLVWNGQVWAEDCTGEIRRMATECVEALYDEVRDERDRDKAIKLLNHTLRSQQAQRLNAMVDLAADALSEKIPVRQDQLDSDRYLVNTPNGVVDLRTRELLTHDPDRLMTRMTRAEYHADAECPRFMQFLDEVFSGDKEVIHYVQKWLGYCLSGDMSEEKFVVLHGKAGAGKSKLLAAIQHVLGDYCTTALKSALLEKRNGGQDNQNLTNLCGARLVFSTEFEPGDELDTGLVKAITGRDVIRMRRHREHDFPYAPQYKLVLASNHLPRLGSVAGDMRRRLRVIPLKAKFYEVEEGQVPVADPRILAKLKREADGILRWLVDGFTLWHKERNTDLDRTPQAVKEATLAAFNDQDALSEWLESCKLGPKYSASLEAVYSDYKEWCDRHNRQYAHRDSRGLSKKLCERDGITKYRTNEGYHLSGIGLVSVISVGSEDKQHFQL